MNDVVIRCAVACDIPDLGISLQRGETRTLNRGIAENSKDLKDQERRGRLRVSWSHPPMKPSRPLPPFVKHSRPQQERPSLPSTQTNLDDLRAFQDQILHGLREVVREEVTAALEAQRFAFESSIRSSRVPLVQKASEFIAEDIPVFIPTKVMGEATGRVQVEAGQSEVGSLDQAQEQLRKMKRKKNG